MTCVLPTKKKKKKKAGEFLSRVISQMLNHFEDYKDPLRTQIKTGIRPLCQDAMAENPAAISDPSRKIIEPEIFAPSCFKSISSI